MLQVLVPSRLESAEYRAKRDEIEMRIAHVNGRFGRAGRTPIEYLHRGRLATPSSSLLYRRADVMMVTPLRDGMNLVAQEFVLCQAAERRAAGRWRGVLLLSEFAGAAHVLPGALLVNPWDADDMVERLVEALALDAAERRRRLDLMADRVEQLDCARWAQGFLARLERYRGTQQARLGAAASTPRRARRIGGSFGARAPPDAAARLRRHAARARRATPISPRRRPRSATCCVDLAALPRTTVHLVSGRKRETLEAWFGDLPDLPLRRARLPRARGRAASWQTPVEVDLSWLPAHRAPVPAGRRATFPARSSSARRASVAWHYRQAEPEYGAWRARELLDALDQLLAGIAAEVLPGHRVIEVRARGVNKGTYVRRLFPAGKGREQTVYLAAGDDVTDIDLYRALPAGSIAIHVGGTRRRARRTPLEHEYVVDSPAALRDRARRACRGAAFGAAGRRRAQRRPVTHPRQERLVSGSAGRGTDAA